MAKLINRILWFLGLVILQVLVLDKVHFLVLVSPFMYVYFILRMEASIDRSELMLWAFAMGLLLDGMLDTPGLHTAALVLTAFLRPYLLRLFTLSGKQERGFVPSCQTMGQGPFFRYTLTVLLIHVSVLMILEFFTFHLFWMLLLKIALSTLLSAVLIWLLDRMVTSK